MIPRQHRPRGRPPWWPATEPWPPTGPPRHAWGAARGRFMWRIGCLFALLPILVFSAFALVFWLVASALGIIQVPRGAFVWVLPLGMLALAVGFAALFFVGRALRRTTAPMAALLEAADHIAAGDYTVRVPEQGPPEVRALAHAFNSMSARLQATDEQRRNLLADVTHELRTPLTVIQGNLEGLLDGIYPADEAHLTEILDETRILSRRIDALRTLALVESGALRLRKEPTDLAALARETAASFHAQADAAGVTLRVDATPDLPVCEVDLARMREVLENLIANALRYTPPGGQVHVRCLTRDIEGRGKSVVVAVEDTGAGIAPEELPHVFDRFYKASDSRGMGLGLAIAKNLIVAQGGDIVARSEPGEGTTIQVILPSSS